jgi:hypothetical protein
MGNMVTTGPWATSDADSTPFLQDQWRQLHRRDGVLDDTAGTALKVTATGSNTSVTVAAGRAIVQGHLGADTNSEAFDIGALGTQPTSGQTRIDLVVLRLNPSTKTIARTVLTGAPASSGATAPALTRSASASWDMPLARVTRVGPVAVSQAMITDLRPHCGHHLGQLPVSTDVTATYSDAPIGSSATVGVDRWERTLAGWTNLSDPPFTTLTLASGWTSTAGETVGYRLLNGRVELCGILNRSADFPVNAFSGTIATLPAGYRPAVGIRCPASSGGSDTSPITVDIGAGGVIRVWAFAANVQSAFLDPVNFQVA